MSETKQNPPVDAAKLEAELRVKLEAELREKIRLENEAAKRNPNAVEPGPRYRTTQKCYLRDEVKEEGAEFTFHGAPGHYMIPLNKEAEEKMKKHGIMDKDGNIRQPSDIVAEGAKV